MNTTNYCPGDRKVIGGVEHVAFEVGARCSALTDTPSTQDRQRALSAMLETYGSDPLLWVVPPEIRIQKVTGTECYDFGRYLVPQSGGWMVYGIVWWPQQSSTPPKYIVPGARPGVSADVLGLRFDD